MKPYGGDSGADASGAHSVVIGVPTFESFTPAKADITLCCGFSIKHWPRKMQIGVLVGGVLSSFLLFFILEEELFKQEHFSYPGMMALYQSAGFATYAMIENIFVLKQPRKAPLHLHAAIGFFASFGTTAGLGALLYLNFPTWALFKSSRILSVMFGSCFLLGKRHSTKEIGGAVLIVVGLILFTLGDVELSPSFNPYGIFLVVLSLILNSLEGNFQEKALKGVGISQNELMLYSNLMGIAYLLPLMWYTGELQDTIDYFAERQHVISVLMIMIVVCSFGMVFIIGLLKATDAVTTTMVTSLRKALTVIFSFILFEKPWGYKHVLGGLSIGLGTYIEIDGAHGHGAPANDKPTTTK
eukprot:TRINITY_DN8780_c0_g1_i1.p1 TRINITY_DN8780_c0_g1~~TRINITY_DN8780_c0_g1_i1.p1  ORF type:complete len:356 (+),score=72.64 TRINITY_DN8780_c0_g1_i1:135-1202(+)